MSHDQMAVEADTSINTDDDSRIDARCAFVVLVATVLGFLLVVSSFDGALGLPGLL